MEDTHNIENIDAADIQFEMIKLEAVPLIEPCTFNQAELDSLLDDPEEIVCMEDDMVITVWKRGCGIPFQANSDELIKRQDDIISGSISFQRNSKYINEY